MMPTGAVQMMAMVIRIITAKAAEKMRVSSAPASPPTAVTKIPKSSEKVITPRMERFVGSAMALKGLVGTMLCSSLHNAVVTPGLASIAGGGAPSAPARNAARSAPTPGRTLFTSRMPMAMAVTLVTRK